MGIRLMVVGNVVGKGATVRATVGLAWRGAAMVAFGATAALAVTLNRPVPAPDVLAIAARSQFAPACVNTALAVTLARGAVGSDPSYRVDFTNTSGSACSLSGYPQVAAYAAGRHGYAQVGNAALREAGGGSRRVVLNPGGTAHSDIEVSVITADRTCKPVTATGLRVVPPGASTPLYLRARLSACSEAGLSARFYLGVRAIAPGTGNPVGIPLRKHPRTGHGQVVA
jgi:hypothetical protein